MLAGIWPLVSARNAEFMKNELRVSVPDEIITRMSRAASGDPKSLDGEGSNMAWAGGVCLIMFSKPGFDLEGAFSALKGERGLTVERGYTAIGVQALVVYHGEGPRIAITHTTGPQALRQAIHLGNGEAIRYADGLGGCDALFWVSVNHLRVASKDRQGLVAVQKSLLRATGGYLYRSWDDHIYSAAEPPADFVA